MGFLDRPERENVNPAKKWLEWKGSKDQGFFQYYDKDEGENIEVKDKMRFLVLEEFHAVGGWSDDEESGIYSNEVLFIGKEPLKVKTYSGKEIAEGLYKEIRNTVSDAGGKYKKKIYAVMNGEIVVIELHGAATQSWGDFTKKDHRRLKEEWVTVEKVEERKKGAIKYKVPIFQFDKSMSDEELAEVTELAQPLIEYLEGKNGSTEQTSASDIEVKAEEVIPEEIPMEDLDL